MLISEMFDAIQETWILDDGTYTGRILEFKPVKEGTYFILKIKVDDKTTFIKD